MVILIKGVKFTIKLLSKENYVKSHAVATDSYAYVNKYDRTIVFRKDYVRKNIVVHEVTHAFINACHLSSCNDLSVEDFEEIVCEMMEDHIEDIIKVSNTILKYLQRTK